MKQEMTQLFAENPGEALLVTRKIAEVARNYRYEYLPVEVITMAKYCFLDPALIAILDRITVELVQDLEETSSEVLLTLTDGRELREFVEEEGPEADKGQEWKRLVNKFLGLTIPVLGKERADLLVQAIERLEDTTTVAEIAALCVLSA